MSNDVEKMTMIMNEDPVRYCQKMCLVRETDHVDRRIKLYGSISEGNNSKACRRGMIGSQ